MSKGLVRLLLIVIALWSQALADQNDLLLTTGLRVKLGGMK